MVKKCLDALLNALFAVIGLIGKIFRLLHREREAVPTTSASVNPVISNISEINLPKPGTMPITTPKPAEIKVIIPKKVEIANPTPESQEIALIKALMILGNRQNVWNLKIIYTWGHLEGSRWSEAEKKLYPFDTYLVLQGNNFWGMKKSSFWDKYIINPLDRQSYNKFDSVAEAVGFLDLFVKKGYTKSYEVRNDYKQFFPLLAQGNWGAYCPGVNYAKDLIARYEQLPSWDKIITIL